MPDNLIGLKNLSVMRSSSFTLNISEFFIHSTTIIGLVGNNGAGKTTFLQAMLNLLEYKCEDLRLFNLTWQKNSTDIKYKIGVFLDETFLIDYMTIDDYFSFLQHVYKTDPFKIQSMKQELIESLQLEIRKKQLINDLSSGNKVKVGLIGSLLHSPELVIWDEPFANLDPYARNKLIEIILRYKRDKNTSFIISSHNIDELYAFCDHFLCLEKGRVVANDAKKNQSKNDILRHLGISSNEPSINPNS